MTIIQSMHRDHVARRARLGAGQPAQIVRRSQVPDVVASHVAVHEPSAQVHEPYDGKPATIKRILDEVCCHFCVSRVDIVSARRTLDITIPRHIACYLCATLGTASYTMIGRALGGRDHTTILYAFRKVRAMMEADPQLCELIAMLTLRIGAANQTENRRTKGGTIRHLTPDDVRHIRKEYAAGKSLPIIARNIGCSYGAVYRVVHRNAWFNVK